MVIAGAVTGHPERGGESTYQYRGKWIMFQGQNFSVRQIEKDRYAFKSAYTQRAGSLSEIQRVVNEHWTESRQSSIELLAIKKALAGVGPAKVMSVEPVQVEAPKVVEPPVEPPTPAKAAPTPRHAHRGMARHRATNKAKTAPKDHIAVVSYPQESRPAPKRRPYGMSYLAQLRAAETPEKAR